MRIATRRLLLREFTPEDWPAVLAYQRDPRYLRYYPWADRSEEDAKRFVLQCIEHQNETPRRKFQLVIALAESQQLIGNCGIRRKAGNDHEADIGYELDPAYWGQGYATEAASALIGFGFSALQLHRISSWCIAENAASAKVLERLGFRLEGRLRENEYFKDRWWDTLLFGLLAGERGEPSSLPGDDET